MFMGRDRKKNREKKKRAKQEERLSSYNEFGKLDLTPKAAIDQKIKKDKRKEKNNEQ